LGRGVAVVVVDVAVALEEVVARVADDDELDVDPPHAASAHRSTTTAIRATPTRWR
jgi:hypothetical protein